ncbi:AraC family transcriptional regulator [Parapedobacter deserti]|uniref:AraC family transcriptional regulator n=1 Tax=Parapedobacter deserti TaxID=1912957 RepID=A0ABV7JRR9_9SPHI
MRAKQLFVQQPVERSFSIRQDKVPNTNSWWHFHGEIELIAFHQGSGLQFVGDSITRFEVGDVVMVGSNVPHCWRYDDATERGQQAGPYSTAIHFKPGLLGEVFMHLPESAGLAQLIDQSRRGLRLRGECARRVLDQLVAVNETDGIHRLIGLLQCLAAFLAMQPNAQPLSSPGFGYQIDHMDEARINKIYSYSFAHLGHPIALADVADLVGLSRTSFCRFFKQRTGKTYVQFLTEIRIGYVCRQLVEKPQRPVKELCYSSGFRNFASFHESFRQITGMSPKAYQALHRAGRVPA